MRIEERAMRILEQLNKDYPDAGPRLKFNSEFECLVAVVLSAQSTDDQVNNVTEELFRVYNTPEVLANLDLQQLEEKIKGVGLFRNKARSIKKLSEEILEKHKGVVPEAFDELLALPGVGRKTANVVRSVAFNKPGLGVDTHVQRIANRMGLVREKNPEKTELGLKAIIPEAQWSSAHHLFLFHGRSVCKARKADCEHCTVKHLCSKVFEDEI